MKSLIKILISLLLLILYKSDTAPRLQRGVNGSEFKTPGKLHILRVADAKPTISRLRYRTNEGQCGA